VSEKIGHPIIVLFVLKLLTDFHSTLAMLAMTGENRNTKIHIVEKFFSQFPLMLVCSY
jgi:hypothetical protein